MKRKTNIRGILNAAVISCSLAALLAGCGAAATESEAVSVSTVSEAEAQSETESSEPESIAESTTSSVQSEPDSEETAEGKTIDTPYFTVEIPSGYVDQIEVEPYINNEGYDYDFMLCFYEKEDHQNEGSGFLFSINIYYRNVDFTYLPQYGEIGTLMEEDGTLLNVVAEYPSDVQFGPDTQELYSELAEQESVIIDSITAKKGITFNAGDCDHSQFESAELSAAEIPEE